MSQPHLSQMYVITVLLLLIGGALLEPPVGIEPTTYCLQGSCSAN